MKHQICQHLDFEPSSLQNGEKEKFVASGTQSMVSVTAARTDEINI